MKHSYLALTLGCAVAACGASPQRVSSTPVFVVDSAGTASSSSEQSNADPGGVGTLQARNERGETGKIRLDRVSVTATQAGDVADVAVEHIFVSESEVPLEGTFRFPMPDGAIVTGLAMMVDGKMIDGELVENDKARKIYEEIVDAMQDPVLMEWEHGSTFKMRVFPIEPHKEKVVTMHYLVPLRKRGGGAVYVQGTRSLDGREALADLKVTWDGKEVFHEKEVASDRLVEVAVERAPDSVRESTKDGDYSVVHLRPDWSRVAPPVGGVPTQWIIVVDTSRSALEERTLQRDSLRTILASLPSTDRFVVATSDLETRLDPAGPRSPTPDQIDAAIAFVDRMPPDGATDIGQMLRVVGQAAKGMDHAGVVYIGDCDASWGETSASRLREEAQRSLAGVPFFPMVLGGSVDADLARELASASGGRSFRAKKVEDVKRFAATLKRVTKHVDAEVAQVPGTVVLPAGRVSLSEGEDLVAYVRTAHGEKAIQAPRTIAVRYQTNGKTFETIAPLGAKTAPAVAKRFGSEWVRELERQKKPKEEIVEASLAFGVMSKHTSFLVLESEEAYEKYAIKRRAKTASDSSTANLDSLTGNAANITLDRIQPGDPEIEIDAPEDAARVVVLFPNGDTKIATWDPEAKEGRGAWMVRFLVDVGTKEGTYEARALIDLANGQHESKVVHYTVDTTAPILRVTMTKARGKHDTFVIHVTQVAEPNQIDTRRVEVSTPDGQTIALTAIRWGEFRGTWTPTRAVSGETLRVVGFDQAFNHAAVDVSVP